MRVPAQDSQHLPGTTLLTETGDRAAAMVAGLSAFLDRLLEEADAGRRAALAALAVTPQTHAQYAAATRAQLARRLGVVEPGQAERVQCPALELVATTEAPALLATAPGYAVYAVRWPVLEGPAGCLHGEGLLLEPVARPPVAQVIVLPDADCAPEQLAGLLPGLPPDEQLARHLAEAGCRVVVPVLVDRADTWAGNPSLGRMTNQPHREWVYRMAYPLGRHILGYEVQQVLALVDCCTRQGGAPVGVYGAGEGGLVALYAGALDERLSAVGVSGAFRNRVRVWQEPIYRNVWGLLRGTSDAEVAAAIAPRALLVEAGRWPQVDGPPAVQPGRRGAAPGMLAPPPLEEVRAEVVLALAVYAALGAAERLTLVEGSGVEAQPGVPPALRAFLQGLGVEATVPPAQAGVRLVTEIAALHTRGRDRQRRHVAQLCRYTQGLLHQAARRRAAFWREAEAAVSTPEAWERACAPYRTYFWDEIIGRAAAPDVPLNPRTRRIYDTARWAGYEVMLDVWEGVFAYGILLVPKDLCPGERRPVVVCQHGLSGRPQLLIEDPANAYRAYAARLAERGYVVYAPQNPYIGPLGDDFRVLQRKANPLQLSLYSFILVQHERTLDWLCAQPFVAPDRIGFYGLSYGGKTALWVAPLLPRYRVVICSGNFNEWAVKLASAELPMSYLFTGEYEMFEFDLASTFNHAELAWLIAPRPFLVERGHHDGVGLDEWVAFEYARVRRRYAELGIADRTELVFFRGGHEIHSTAAFAFLDRYLEWTPRRG